MKFPFLCFPSDPCVAFPKRRAIYRPVIPIHIYSLDLKHKIHHYALLDTGADYNLFHSDFLDVLDIEDVESGKVQNLFGIEGKGVKCYFHHVIIGIGDWRYKAFTGFTDYGMVNSPDQMSYGILGQLGFFEHFKVKFDYKKRKIEVIPNLFSKEDFLERVKKSKQEIKEGKTISWNKLRSKIEVK